MRLIKNYMQKLGVIIFLGLLFASCSKNNSQNCSAVTISAPSSEVDSLKAYLSKNNITATEDSRGFFYIITSPGSGTKPTVCNTVTVNYKGTLTNGTQFDAANNVSFPLGELVVGWQEAIPLIAAGGSITLYLPPSLGYGAAGSSPVPGNAITIFTIDLTSIQ